MSLQKLGFSEEVEVQCGNVSKKGSEEEVVVRFIRWTH